MTEHLETAWHQECSNLEECGVRRGVSFTSEVTNELVAILAPDVMDPEGAKRMEWCPLCGAAMSEWRPGEPPDDDLEESETAAAPEGKIS